jgi:PHD domain of transcriptional enhancer, Asx
LNNQLLSFSSLTGQGSLPPGRYVLIQNATGQIVPVPLQSSAAIINVPMAQQPVARTPARAVSAPPPATEALPPPPTAATPPGKDKPLPVRPASVDAAATALAAVAHRLDNATFSEASSAPEGVAFGQSPESVSIISAEPTVVNALVNISPAAVNTAADSGVNSDESHLNVTATTALCDNYSNSVCNSSSSTENLTAIEAGSAPSSTSTPVASPVKNLVIRQLVKIKPNTNNKGNKMMLKSYGVPLLPKPPSMVMVVGGGQQQQQHGGGGGGVGGGSTGRLCNMKALVACQSCGAYCHDDCISANRLCFTCLIR